MKLKLIFLNDDAHYGEEQILKNLPDGQPRIVSSNYFNTLLFNGLKIVGQNRLIYKIHNEFFNHDKKIVYLCGEVQAGKTSICKLFSNHM